MDTTRIAEPVDQRRRLLLGTAAASLAVTQLGRDGFCDGTSHKHQNAVTRH